MPHTATHTSLPSDAEGYITRILQRKPPYHVKVLGSEFLITSLAVYPSGRLSSCFMRYLLSQDLVAGKMVAEVGVGCFALGILAAKHGAKAVVGTDISSEAIACAKFNRVHHGVEQQTTLLEGEGLSPLLPHYEGRIDVLLCGAPWDRISAAVYQQLPRARQGISQAFYDIDDRLITALLTRAKTLLAPRDKLFITSAMSKIGRLEKLCATHQVAYTIVVEEDIHEDGNMHYILEVSLS